MKFTEKIEVLLHNPTKALQYFQYGSSRLLHGDGVAKIPFGGRIHTSSFSEYLSVYGLMPDSSELAMIQKFLNQAKEVFDLGANVGVWTVLMNKANPEARVHAFEPNPATHALLERNVKENNCANVRLNLAAVSESAGQLNFQIPPNASIFGRVAPVIKGTDAEGRFSNVNSFVVPAVCLNEYCKTESIGEIDFLKIDIEGHELAALRGIEKWLNQRRIKAIYIETIRENHDRMGTCFSELLRFINDCGYRFHTLSRDGNPGPVVMADQIQAHNHLCLPA